MELTPCYVEPTLDIIVRVLYITFVLSSPLCLAYIDLGTSANDDATIAFSLGDSGSNLYKIQVTQLSCSDPSVTGNTGCFQYFTGKTGTLNSFNVAGQAQLSTLSYNYCIRQELGHCCIEYTAISFALSPFTCDTTANRCAGGRQCSDDYIIVPGVSNVGTSYSR